jgi:outer membrane protein assembly factor BamB
MREFMEQRQSNIIRNIFSFRFANTRAAGQSIRTTTHMPGTLLCCFAVACLFLCPLHVSASPDAAAGAAAGDQDAAPSQSTPAAWQHETLDDIDWYLTAPEVLIVITNRGARALSQTNGEQIWRFDVGGFDPSRFEQIPYTHFALVSFPYQISSSGSSVALIDLTNGDELWNSNKNKLTRAYGSFLVPHKDGLLVYGEQAGRGKVLMLLDFETGVPKWSIDRPFHDWIPDMFGEGAQPPLFDSEDTMILFLNARAIRKYDLTSGKLIWEVQDLKPASGGNLFGETTQKEKETLGITPTLAAGYAPLVLAGDGRSFFAPHHNTVGAFATFNGARRWMSPTKLEGIVTQMERIPQGLLVRTIPGGPEESGAHYLSLINIRNGQELWRNSRSGPPILKEIFGAWFSSTPFLVESNRVVVAGGDKLFSIALDTGRESKICDLDFQGADEVSWLEVRNDQYIVQGEQNVVWCDVEGNVTRRIYYDPPDDFAKGLAWLAAAAVINSADDIRIGKLNISVQADYSAGFEDLLRDYTATIGGADYVYMLTESDEGPQIVRVSKDDGAESNRIHVDTKEPDYLICPYTGHLFWKSSERTISCFVF